MDFSDQWRSLFSIPSTCSSLSPLSCPSLGALRFFPFSPSVPLSLFPSLQIAPPPLPPSYQIAALTFLFSDPSAPFFLPRRRTHPLQLPLLLRRRSSPSTAFLFFPTGDNFVGFASDLDSVFDLSGESTITVEGFLIAATLYAVNWFRVETKVSSIGQETVGLVLMGKQRFASVIVDTRINPRCPEESIVLLESGELCWFNMETKGSRLIRVSDKVRGLPGMQLWGTALNCACCLCSGACYGGFEGGKRD